MLPKSWIAAAVLTMLIAGYGHPTNANEVIEVRQLPPSVQAIIIRPRSRPEENSHIGVPWPYGRCWVDPHTLVNPEDVTYAGYCFDDVGIRF